MNYNKPANWDDIKPAPFGKLKIVPDGYILKVIHAGELITPNTREPAIRIFFDIAEGDFIDYFKKLSDAKNKAISLDHLQLIENKNSLPYYKRLVNFFEECNVGFTYDFSAHSLWGKRIGAVCGDEEYLDKKNDEIKIKLSIRYFCPISTIVEGNFRIPKLKKLDTSFPPSDKKPAKKKAEELAPNYDSYFNAKQSEAKYGFNNR